MNRATLCIMLAVLAATGCSGRTGEQQTAIGQTHLLLNAIDDAEAAFRSAIDADPTRGQAHLGLARCLTIQGDLDGALDSYRRAAELPETAVAACFEAADIELRLANSAGADAWAERLSTTKPENGAILKAFLLQQAGDHSGAEGLLVKTADDFGGASSSAIELAWLYAMNGNRERAAELYESVAKSPDNSGNLAMLAAELRSMDVEIAFETKSDVANAWEAARRESYDTAQHSAEPFATGPNATPWANVVLGYCADAQGASREAERLLRLASFELPTSLFVRDLLANVRGELGVPVAQSAPAIAVDPEAWRELWTTGRLLPLLDDRAQWGDAPELRDVLYVAALVTGNVDLAASLATDLAPDSWLKPYADAMDVAVREAKPEDLLNLIDNWPSQADRDVVLMRNASARAYAVAQLRARALEQILRCLVDAPENAVALYNLATLYREAGMPSHELEAWRRLLARNRHHEEAQERVYTLLVQQRRFAEARRTAEAAYVSNPDDPASLVRLADASFKTGDPDFGLAALVKNVQAHPENRMALRALARGYLVVGDGENAVATLENHPDEHDLRAFAFTMTGAWDDAMTTSAADEGSSLLQAALFANADQYDDAELILQRIALTRPARILLDALISRKDADADVDTLALTLGTRADVLGEFALGAAYSAAGLAVPALDHWHAVSEAIGFDTELTGMMLAELARTGVVPEKALAGKQLVEQDAGSPDAWLGLADVHASMENSNAKSEALERAATLAVDSADIWQSIAQRVDESDTAMLLRAFQNLYRLHPDDPVVKNNFAYALLQSGESRPDPLPLAESAFEALGARSHVLHTLGLALVQAGRIDEAREKLYQALEQRPGDPTLMLDFGKALIAKGELEEGARLVQASITYADRLRVAFPRRAEAESILAKEAA